MRDGGTRPAGFIQQIQYPPPGRHRAVHRGDQHSHSGHERPDPAAAVTGCKEKDNNMTLGLFRRDGDLYHPNQAALGPWSPDFLHGGSPSGLLAAVMEDAMDGADLRLARFTLDL